MSNPFNGSNLQDQIKWFKALAHPIRLSIVKLLGKGEELTVTQIYSRLELDQAITSQHLSILKKRNIVGTRREGKNSIYYLADEKVIEGNRDTYLNSTFSQQI